MYIYFLLVLFPLLLLLFFSNDGLVPKGIKGMVGEGGFTLDLCHVLLLCSFIFVDFAYSTPIYWNMNGRQRNYFYYFNFLETKKMIDKHYVASLLKIVILNQNKFSKLFFWRQKPNLGYITMTILHLRKITSPENQKNVITIGLFSPFSMIRCVN